MIAFTIVKHLIIKHLSLFYRTLPLQSLAMFKSVFRFDFIPLIERIVNWHCQFLLLHFLSRRLKFSFYQWTLKECLRKETAKVSNLIRVSGKKTALNSIKLILSLSKLLETITPFQTLQMINNYFTISENKRQEIEKKARYYSSSRNFKWSPTLITTVAYLAALKLQYSKNEYLTIQRRVCQIYVQWGNRSVCVCVLDALNVSNKIYPLIVNW